MGMYDKFIKRGLSVILCLILLVSAMAFASTFSAKEADAAMTGADTYYLWGENTNSPNFSGSTPTGTFTYDSSEGYYYYDLNGVGGDYCFVISTVNSSASRAVSTPAVQSVASSGSYSAGMGSYHGYNCLHIWNPSGDNVRIYFKSATEGIYVVKQGGEATQPAPTSGGTGSGNYVYCKNEAGWSSVSAYMWVKDTENNNHAWPGVGMTNIGNNIWRYEVPTGFNMIIFNANGQPQTGNIEYPASGNMYNNKTNQWENYGGVEPTSVTPTQGGGTVEPTTVTPTQGGGTSGKYSVYCVNEAGWSSVYAYMWNSSSDTVAAWPGVKMTNIGENVWRYDYSKSYSKIIFNSGSDQNKTADLNHPGSGYVYNNKSGEWEVYDTSPLQVKAYKTDLESPQLDGVGITLTANAAGEGTVYYKFSVGTTVLSDYSTRNSVLWIPKSAGTYTITYEFRDSKGNTNKRTKSFTIESGASSVAPYIKVVNPAGGEVKTNTAVNISVSAGGGKTGTNLLFYKYTVKNASGSTVNVPYYKLNNTSYSYTPTAAGDYTLTVSVQGSDNKVAERTFSFKAVGSLTPTQPVETQGAVPTQPETQTVTQPETEPETQPVTQPETKPETQPVTQPETKPETQPATQPVPTEPQGMLGDADEDNDVNVDDVTFIQRYDVQIPLPKAINLKNADVDFSGVVDITDATWVQRYLAGIIDEFKRR